MVEPLIESVPPARHARLAPVIDELAIEPVTAAISEPPPAPVSMDEFEMLKTLLTARPLVVFRPAPESGPAMLAKYRDQISTEFAVRFFPVLSNSCPGPPVMLPTLTSVSRVTMTGVKPRLT